MGWTATITYTTGELITADMLNKYLSANPDYLKGNAGTIQYGAGAIFPAAVVGTAFQATAGTAPGLLTGDISADRGSTAGYVWLGNNGTHYVGFDGTNYLMPVSNLMVNGQPAVRAAVTTTTLVDSGLATTGSVADGASGTVAVTFNKAFTVAPIVMVSLANVSGGAGVYPRVGVGCQGITTTGFNLSYQNATGLGAETITANWIALGQG